jgi:hypothetical protein
MEAVLTLGALIGWLFGRSEAMEVKLRIDNRNMKKLPHVMLWLFRGFLIALLVLQTGKDWPWMIKVFSASMLAFASVHRIAFNIYTRRVGVTMTREWWYMGSCRRYLDDSWYDTAWWIVTAKRVQTKRGERGKYLLIRPGCYQAPWMAAQTFEVLAIALLWWWAK